MQEVESHICDTSTTFQFSGPRWEISRRANDKKEPDDFARCGVCRAGKQALSAERNICKQGEERRVNKSNNNDSRNCYVRSFIMSWLLNHLILTNSKSYNTYFHPARQVRYRKFKKHATRQKK
jgi:hypothetical protein